MARRISVEIVGDSRSLERAFGRAHKSASKFNGAMRAIGTVGVAGVAGGFAAMGLALKAGFSELAEAQKVAAQTNAVLKSTGGVAGVSAKHVDAFASSLSRMSGVDDEAIASAENLLLTFTNIRNAAGKGNDVFDQTTKVALDMSTALGMDLNSAAMMVGKAMAQMDVTSQGNVRGFMALRRVGVQVTPEMMRMAAAFIKAGKPMEAQKLLLRELNTEFGGSAAAFGQTMPGQLGKLKNALSEVAAAFAIGLLPVVRRVTNWLTKKLTDPAFMARVQELGVLVGTKLANAFRAISRWFKAHWEDIKGVFSTGAAIAAKMANATRRIVVWFRKLADVTPGGGETLLGLFVGGLLLRKLRPVAALLLTIIKRMRIIGGGGGTIPGNIPGNGTKKRRPKFWLPGKFGTAGAAAAIEFFRDPETANAPVIGKDARSQALAAKGGILGRYRSGDTGMAAALLSANMSVLKKGLTGPELSSLQRRVNPGQTRQSGNVTVNVNGAGDPAKVAREVVKEIQKNGRVGPAAAPGTSSIYGVR